MGPKVHGSVINFAKSLTLDLKCSGGSFMYARDKMGLRTETWREASGDWDCTRVEAF